MVSQASQRARGSVALHRRFMAVTDACTKGSLPAELRDYLLCGSLCLSVPQEKLRRCGGDAHWLNMGFYRVFRSRHLRLTHGNSLEQWECSPRCRSREADDGPHGLLHGGGGSNLHGYPERSTALSTREWWRQQLMRWALYACGSAERSVGTRCARNDAVNIFRGFVASAGRVQL